MGFVFRPCELETDHEAYMKFLIQHHNQLNLPYPFAVKLGFVSSPLMYGKALLIFSEEPYEIVGVAGYEYGTGANNYEDRHICQIEVAYLQEEHRCTLLFHRSMQALVKLIKAGESDVTQVQFWLREDNEFLQRLCRRFLVWSGSSKKVIEGM